LKRSNSQREKNLSIASVQHVIIVTIRVIHILFLLQILGQILEAELVPFVVFVVFLISILENGINVDDGVIIVFNKSMLRLLWILVADIVITIIAHV